MAPTYELIASNTLGSAAASVTFSSIPATYTDLIVRVSARGLRNGNSQVIWMRYNGATNTVYSSTWIRGAGSAGAISSTTGANSDIIDLGVMPAVSDTANTFNNLEIYIPNYGSSTNKPISSFNVSENNNSVAFLSATASLGRNTNPVSSITFLDNGFNFVAGSSFFLYGIKST
jgi:hypothetical protein